MSSISGRGLHYVFKLGDRGANSTFFRDVLGMQVLRHEEFEEGGCGAKCNGPYENHWSKTMIGYGSEHTHFIMEVMYNYGISSYELGNEFVGITIRSSESLERARALNYPILVENGVNVLVSPDGYKFYIIDEPQPTTEDPVVRLTLSSTDLAKSLDYWHGTLEMKIRSQSDEAAVLFYDKFIELELRALKGELNRGTAFGRTVFAVPFDQQPYLNERIKATGNTILHELLSLDTPGKATVRVLVLADPDGHEICFVDEEGFSALSDYDPESAAGFDKFIAEDPFQK